MVALRATQGVGRKQGAGSDGGDLTPRQRLFGLQRPLSETIYCGPGASVTFPRPSWRCRRMAGSNWRKKRETKERAEMGTLPPSEQRK